MSAMVQIPKGAALGNTPKEQRGKDTSCCCQRQEDWGTVLYRGITARGHARRPSLVQATWLVSCRTLGPCTSLSPGKYAEGKGSSPASSVPTNACPRGEQVPQQNPCPPRRASWSGLTSVFPTRASCLCVPIVLAVNLFHL